MINSRSLETRSVVTSLKLFANHYLTNLSTLSCLINHLRAYFFCNQVLISEVKHLGCHHKHILHVVAGLGWSLNKVGYFEFSLELLSLFCRHFSGCLSVFHVANQNYDDVWLTLLFGFSDPRLQIQERVHSRNIVAETNAVSTSIKDFCDRFKGLLARSVPYLQFEHLWLKFDD